MGHRALASRAVPALRGCRRPCWRCPGRSRHPGTPGGPASTAARSAGRGRRCW